MRALTDRRTGTMTTPPMNGWGDPIAPRPDLGEGIHDLRCNKCDLQWADYPDAVCPACHAREEAARIRQELAFNGHGMQAGPLRPDYGPGWADVKCDQCDATWTGVVGEACWWCFRSHEITLEHQAQLVLTPPEVEADLNDVERDQAYKAWAERLAVAVDAGIISQGEARAAWKREKKAA